MKRFLLFFHLLLITALLQQAVAQDRSISGQVTDRANGQGLPGVTVLVKGTTIGASTNAEGSYTLSVPASATTLSFSSIGYLAVERPIGTAATINVTLATDAKQLSEVIVTGALGIQRQQGQVGYATATLNTEEVTQARPTNVVNGLTSKVSGLQIQTLGSGINPSVRVTLRGNRSLTGNNEALIVVDGIISPNDVLAQLNPDDIASISVLKGANAAALYGSQAANGALIITTRKGGTTPKVTFSQTSQIESLSFLPKFQGQFGSGANSYTATLPAFAPNGEVDTNYGFQYQSFENQQYGPRFDGSVQPLGEVLANGDLQTATYQSRLDEKRKFFNNAYQVQNSVTFSGGDEKTKFFTSFQNVHNNGVINKDKYDRNNFRFNASRELGRLSVGFNVAYSQQKINFTSNTGTSVYDLVFNTPAMIPITQYKNWRTDEYANPNGYYNAYFANPYFVIDNERTNDKRNTLLGSVDLSFKVRDWLKLNYRIGTTNISQAGLATQNKFTYNAYIQGGNTNKGGGGVTGYVQDLSSTLTRINSDLFASMDKTFGDYSIQAILGNNVQQLDSRYNFVNSTALATPDLFNLGNRIGNLGGSNGSAQTRLYAFYADVTLGYKGFLYVHGSGRNDNVSYLDPGNRSFFYPGVDASFIFSNAIPALKEFSFLDYGKLRGGITKVSNVNLNSNGARIGAFTDFGVFQTGGAYSLASTYSLGGGYPFGSLASFTANNTLVQPGLKPEDTRSIETGVELSFLQHRIAGGLTYYSQKSNNQTINTNISGSSGYTGLLLNAGEVQNHGIEADLNLIPVRLNNGLTFTIGGNFNYNNNKVISLPGDLPQLALSSGGNAQLVAIPGQPFPTLQGSHYQRVADGPSKGLIQMTKITDPFTKEDRYVPLKAADVQNFGNTQPKYKYGFNSSVTYKGITLSGQGELRTGYVVYNAIGETLDFTGAGQRSVTYDRQNFVYPNSAIPQTDAAGNVTYVPNTTGLTPGGSEFWASSAYNRSVAENYVTSGKFFKIRELALSYVVPAEMLSKVAFVKGASLSLFGRNIWTWVPKENIYTDPEFNFSNSNAIGINTSYQTPPTKFYGATLTATF